MSNNYSLRSLALRQLLAWQDQMSIDDSHHAQMVEALTEKDRSLYHELTKGVARYYSVLVKAWTPFINKKPRALLKNILCLGAYQTVFLDRIPDFAIADETKKLGIEFGISAPEAKFLQGVLAKLRAFTADQKALLRQQALDILIEDQEYLVAQMKKLAKAEGKDFSLVKHSLDSMMQASQICGYARGSSALSLPKVESPLVGSMYLVDNWDEAKTPLESKDLIVQGECSQWACQSVAKILVERNSHRNAISVLEVGAGLGGKTLSTAHHLKKLKVDTKNWQWVAVDKDFQRLNVLQDEVIPLIDHYHVEARLGALDAVLNNEEKFDLVWIDAPCSGWGTIAKNPEVLFRANREHVDSLKKIQMDLIHKSLQRLKSGGNLVYTLCTLSFDESIGLLDEVLKEHADLTLSDVKSLWPATSQNGGGPMTNEGFFFSVLRKA